MDKNWKGGHVPLRKDNRQIRGYKNGISHKGTWRRHDGNDSGGGVVTLVWVERIKNFHGYSGEDGPSEIKWNANTSVTNCWKQELVNRLQTVSCLLLLSNEISIKRNPFVRLANRRAVMVNFTAGWVDCKRVSGRELDFFMRLEDLGQEKGREQDMSWLYCIKHTSLFGMYSVNWTLSCIMNGNVAVKLRLQWKVALSSLDEVIGYFQFT
jgi:hypothetical protein